LLAALAYWVLMRVDRTPVLPSASVVHRSARPELGPMPGRRPEAPEMQPPPPDLPSPTPPVAEHDADAGATGPPEQPSD
jgi:hypothetical protein